MARAAKKKSSVVRPKRARLPKGEPGSERRRAPRFPVDFEVDYRAEDTFLYAYISNVSEMGIFVRTDSPEPFGSQLVLRFKPPGFDHPLELQGRVMWINRPREAPEPGRSPGMGVQFVELTVGQRGALLELVRRLAYLEDDDADSERS